MTSSDTEGRNPLWRCALATAITMALASTAHAQQAQNQDEEEADDPSGVEEILVTGSRLKRDTFSSIAPLQVITGEISREAGLLDPSAILQEAAAATGQQIDLTFGGFVLDNGPGAQTVSLRGLGSNRTLVLLNGRRIAPGGVEGAPTSPDLSLLPNSLIDQFDILLDGASSIYGSDAVAGVTNVVLRQDFDGLEVEAFSGIPQQDGGQENVISVAWGKNTDRGFFGIGIEATDRERVSLDDREWTEGCERPYEVTANGEFRDEDIFFAETQGQRTDGCIIGGLAGRILAPIFGSVYFAPGRGNALPNFSESSLFGGASRTPVDGDGNGETDVSFRDHDINGRAQFADLISEQQTISAMAYGEYTFEGEANLTPYFEALYTKRESDIDSGAFQLFPVVSANNPFNPCNPNGAGVDCGLAYDGLLNNPNFAADFAAINGLTPAGFRDQGIVDLFQGAIGPASVQPVVSVRGDRTLTFAEVDQTRVVGGLRGDLPNFSFGLGNWSWDVSASYSKNTGDVRRPGILDDRLTLSTSTTIEDPNNPGSFICGVDADGDGVPDGTDGCVPVNLFAPSLYEGVIGDFATQAERDYLFGNRTFDTEYEQTIFSAYITGGLFELPAGAVSAGFGLEWRDDEITSIPNDIARDGLFFGFFADGGATGSKTTEEFFGEIELPLLANQPFATQLDLNLSARSTKDEFYGREWTYAAKVGWRPVNSLLVRATYGTSYRAPNLRENFLRSQTGFGNIADPCVVPDGAFDSLTGVYDPAGDTRDPLVLSNCLANGVDPTALDNNGFSVYSVEVASGGATGLTEETSDSLSVGFSFDQPWIESFDLSLGATYYEIEIEDTIVEPTGQFIVNDCFNSEVNSTFCSRITRDADGFIDLLDAGFINRDNETVRGVDVNVNFEQPVTIFSRPVDLSADLVLNHPIEVSETFTSENGDIDFDNDRLEFGFPSWNGTLRLRADIGDYRVSWNTRYIGEVRQDEDFVDDFDDITGASDTCLPGVLCRDVGFADDYMTHDVSLYYRGDVWTLGGGVRNVFEEAPPRVDGSEVFSVNNTPIGFGYDLDGRTFFLNVAASFSNF